MKESYCTSAHDVVDIKRLKQFTVRLWHALVTCYLCIPVLREPIFPPAFTGKTNVTTKLAVHLKVRYFRILFCMYFGQKVNQSERNSKEFIKHPVVTTIGASWEKIERYPASAGNAVVLFQRNRRGASATLVHTSADIKFIKSNICLLLSHEKGYPREDHGPLALMCPEH